MKHALALLLLSCVLVAQDKPAAEAPKPAAATPDPFAGIVADFQAGEMRKQKLLQAPVNARDSLIELINQLKEDASALIPPPSDPDDFGGTNGRIRADIYIAKMKAKADAKNTLLQALVELSKLPADSPLHHHSIPFQAFWQRWN